MGMMRRVSRRTARRTARRVSRRHVALGAGLLASAALGGYFVNRRRKNAPDSAPPEQADVQPAEQEKTPTT